jgi:hypothetical protein
MSHRQQQQQGQQQQQQGQQQQQAHNAALQAMCMAFERKLRMVSSIGGS